MVFLAQLGRGDSQLCTNEFDSPWGTISWHKSSKI